MKKRTVNPIDILHLQSTPRAIVLGSVLAGLGLTLLAIAIIGLSSPAS